MKITNELSRHTSNWNTLDDELICLVQKLNSIIENKTIIENADYVVNSIIEMSEIFDLLKKESDTFCIYWDYCSHQTYLDTYDERKNNYLEDYKDANELDFIDSEKSSMKTWRIKKGLFYRFFDQFDELLVEATNHCNRSKNDITVFGFFSKVNTICYYSWKRKFEFLEARKKQIENNNNNDNIPMQHEVEYKDFSDSKDPEKFVMLIELGIIDYLKSKFIIQPSERKLASLLSTFTGISAENLRKNINGTKNKDHNNKYTEENIRKAKNKLLQLDIDPNIFRLMQ